MMTKSTYLVLQLRGGDMVSMYRLYSNRNDAYQFIEDYRGETNSVWWKVLPLPHEFIEEGQTYDIVLDVRWQTSNRVIIVGVYETGMIPNNIRENPYYSAETLLCE